jgi:hypothetical protein
MGALVGILTSIAASAIFFLVEPRLLAMGEPWRLIATAVVFLISAGLALYLCRRTPDQAGAHASMLSDNEIGKGLKARIEEVDLPHSSGSRIASGNKVGGSAHIEIKNSTL